MVSKTVCFSLAILAVTLMTATAKPTSDDEMEYSAHYPDDTIAADSPHVPPKLRMNRHGKRGSVNGQDNYEELEYVMYDTTGKLLEDHPQRLRMNRHGK